MAYSLLRSTTQLFKNKSAKALQISLALTASAFTTLRLFNWYSTYTQKQRLQAAIKHRDIERRRIFEKLKLSLSSASDETLEKRKRIVSLPIRSLIDQLQNEQLSAVEVLEAFQTSALHAQEKTNCITQFIVEARDCAEKLDRTYKGRKDKPPLFGLPFSVKESNGVKGYDATAGYAQYLYLPMPADSALVAVLREKGAIPFALTNVPQTLLAFITANPVYGVTCNPYDATRTAGGSSGGEGALLALRGAAFGVGSDLAGSIRIPSHYCGVAGIKPSTNRVSSTSHRKAYPGRPVTPGSHGPMAPDVETLALITKHLLSQDLFDRDMYVSPIPFREELYDPEDKQKAVMTIGYYEYDGFMEITPACRRALQMAKDVLLRNGHKVVPFDVPEMHKAVKLFQKSKMLDAGQHITDMLSRDIPEKSLETAMEFYTYSKHWRRLFSKAAEWLGSPKYAIYLDTLPASTTDLRLTYAGISEYRSVFAQQWKRLGLDAMLCPVNPGVAMPLDYPPMLFCAFSYTFLYTLLDYCAGVVPVTKVIPDDEEAMKGYVADEFYSTQLKKINSKGTVGLPVGVQCAAPPNMEEVCLLLMKTIEDGLKK